MEAIYYQLEKSKTGVKVTAWEQNFDYEETCGHVYLTKKVYKNGAKSTVTAYAKVTEQDISGSILTCNTYFWSPGSSSGTRRYNEKKRNAELEGFMRDNYLQAVTELNELFADNLREKEYIELDKLGASLFYRNQKYHFAGRVSAKSIAAARVAIRERRIKDITSRRIEKLNVSEYAKLLSKVFVTKSDSVSAGNCPTGTSHFYNNLDLVKKGFRIRALRADVLLSICNNVYTQRAVKYAITRQLS